MINYSFIIPHYNSPNLLNRCLDSIPKRDDIQIIVVDDNSPLDGKPHIEREDVQLIEMPKSESNGAGKARNVGLDCAKGKWILFADADDFYSDGFISDLDNEKDNDLIDIVFFNTTGVYSDNLEPSNVADRVRGLISNAGNSDADFEKMKFRTNVPWCKMIKLSYINAYGFRFEEVRKGNDIMFCYQTSYFTNRIKVINKDLYVYTYNRDSITHSQRSVEASLHIIQNKMKVRAFYDFLGHPDWKIKTAWNTILSVLKNQGLVSFFKFLLALGSNYREYKKLSSKYIDLINSVKEKHDK